MLKKWRVYLGSNEFRELKVNVGILSQALDFSDKEWRQEWENHL